MSGLRVLHARYGQALDEDIRRRLGSSVNPVFAGMMRYQFGYVDAELRAVPAPGGKRFRPLLCLLACEAVGGDWRQAVPAASAIELLHNFSLIHDDIEDHDPARRHRPTVWKVWGEPHAINVGDAVFAEAMRTILDIGAAPDVKVDIARNFGTMALKLTEGQYRDMEFEGRLDVAPDEYLEMVKGKTASLIAFCLVTGSQIGGAGTPVRDALRKCGEFFGQAFQIQDDIQGIWAAAEDTGKEVAKDLENRKKSLPVLLSLEKAGEDQRSRLLSFYSSTSNNVDGVLEVLEATGARRQAEFQMHSLRASGEESLAQANLPDEFSRLLLEVIEEITRVKQSPAK